MKSYRDPSFKAAFALLPDEVKNRARTAYQLFRKDPFHQSLQFKQVHATKPIYSARVGLNYHALAVRRGDTVV